MTKYYALYHPGKELWVGTKGVEHRLLMHCAMQREELSSGIIQARISGEIGAEEEVRKLILVPLSGPIGDWANAVPYFEDEDHAD